MHNALPEFQAAMRANGLEPPAEIIPGKLHRFPANGKRGDNAGWCKLFEDERGGVFGNWREGYSETWQARCDRPLTPAEREAHARQVEAAKRERAAEEARAHAEARTRAAGIWKAANQATASHPYLKQKGVMPHGARLQDNRLVIPARDSAGELHSLQFIAPDGEKRYLTGGRISGCYHSIGSGKPEKVLCIAEGYATAASIHEATGYAVAVAFDAGNLEPVAHALRAKYPELTLVLCADDDLQTPGNPGITKATAAALAVGGKVAAPDFGQDRPEGVSDFNDMHKLAGLEAVRAAVEAARLPEGQPAPEKAPEGAEDYPQPKALPIGLPPVDAFIFELLPDSLRPWAEDICERVQCPPDFVGATILTALGSVIGRKVAIRPQGQTDWTEYANQWGLVVGRPGVLKSPAMEAALAPLKRLAANAAGAYATEAEDYAHKLKVTKLRQEAGEKAARAKLSKSALADVRDDLSIPDPEEPKLRRYIANDTSYESLGAMLGDNPNGVLVFRDELVSLLKTLDREDNAGARGFYLTGWSGNSPYTFDRITRGRVSIPAVTLSLLGSTQPGRIAEYIRGAVTGGSGDDGLIQRFGLLVWPDIGGEWREVDRWPDTEAKRQAFAVFDRLDTLDPLDLGASQDVDFNGNPDGQPFLRFAPDALEEFRAWRGPYEKALRSGEEHPALESHMAKYRKLAPSLALILHLANGDRGHVSKLATEQALGWIEYLASHARRAYASVSSPETAAAKAIVDRLRRGDIPRVFAPRDIYRKGWAHLSDPKLVHDALALLVDLDWIFTETRETEGRWAKEYQANPRGFPQ